MPEDVFTNFADKIENNSNIINIEMIPIIKKFDPEINDKLVDDVERMLETLLFSCKINIKKHGEVSEIHTIYNSQNAKMNKIM